MVGTTVVAFFVLGVVQTQFNLATVILGSTDMAGQCIALISSESTLKDYKVTKARINTDSKKDYILKGDTDTLCGSTGCIYRLCLVRDTVVTILPFMYAAERLEIKSTTNGDMHDIHLAGKSEADLQWNGTKYIVVQ